MITAHAANSRATVSRAGNDEPSAARTRGIPRISITSAITTAITPSTPALL